MGYEIFMTEQEKLKSNSELVRKIADMGLAWEVIIKSIAEVKFMNQETITIKKESFIDYSIGLVEEVTSSHCEIVSNHGVKKRSKTKKGDKSCR